MVIHVVLTTSEILARGEEPRQCVKCGKVKKNKDFPIHRRSADGRTTECKECRNKYSKDRYYNKLS